MTDQLELIAAPPRRPVLRYHGGKFRIASWIVRHFPPHRTYVEPFGGAASVLLRKPRSHSEVYNDVDDEIVNVFRVLRDAGGSHRLTEALRLTPFARRELETSYDDTPDPVERARRTIVRSFMGFSSASVTKGHRTGFRGNASSSRVTSAVDWVSYADCVESFVERLRGVAIENKSAFHLIPQYDGEEALFFVDPPYPLSTRYASANYADCYRHELSDADHRVLAQLLRSLRGMVVLSSYGSALYRDLFRGWSTIEKTVMASGTHGSVTRREVLFLSPRTAAALAQAG